MCASTRKSCRERGGREGREGGGEGREGGREGRERGGGGKKGREGRMPYCDCIDKRCVLSSVTF